MSDERTYRIKDIAERAGVSIGTVDRVIHNRGDVSKSSIERVRQVMQELNFRPNRHAAALAQSRIEHRFAYMIPHHSEGSYWAEIERGVVAAAKEATDINLTLEYYYFDQYSAESFNIQAEAVFGSQPRGVIFPPIFREEAISFIERLNIISIPFSLFDSYIDNKSMVSFFGQNGALSGRLAYKLLMLHTTKGSDVALLKSYRDGNRVSTQSTLRRAGFQEAMMECGGDKVVNIETIELPMHSEVEAQGHIEKFLSEHPHLNAIVVFNSRSYLIASALQKLDRQDIVVIGFDALERNVEALKSGYISALIGQRPELQGYRTLKSLCDHTLLKQEVKRYNFMPLDILIRENIDEYRSFLLR